jgi:hypothetical protein
VASDEIIQRAVNIAERQENRMTYESIKMAQEKQAQQEQAELQKYAQVPPEQDKISRQANQQNQAQTGGVIGGSRQRVSSAMRHEARRLREKAEQLDKIASVADHFNYELEAAMFELFMDRRRII